jgi:hypothetical protein
MPSLRPLLLLALLGGPLTLARAQTVWLVDASGGGNFSSLAEAAATAESGDVLWIAPGEYGPLSTTKRLTLLADETEPRPRVASIELLGAAGFQALHLEIRSLRLSGPGRVLIDDCRIGPGEFWRNFFGTFLVTNGADLLLSRCFVQGGFFAADGAPALLVEKGSTAQVVSSVLRGAHVAASEDFKLSGFGGPGLVVRTSARVWVVDSELQGGDGQDYGQGSAFQPGGGGSGLVVGSGARVDLRGQANDRLSGGLQNPGLSGPFDGPALFCQPGLPTPQALLGPISISGTVAACAVQGDPPRSFLVPADRDVGSPERRVHCFGPAGQAAVLATSFQSALEALPLVAETPVFLDSGALAELLPILLQGFDEGAEYTWLAPSGPAFAGLAYHVQLFEVWPASGLLGANSITFVLAP